MGGTSLEPISTLPVGRPDRDRPGCPPPGRGKPIPFPPLRSVPSPATAVMPANTQDAAAAPRPSGKEMPVRPAARHAGCGRSLVTSYQSASPTAWLACERPWLFTLAVVARTCGRFTRVIVAPGEDQ